MIYQYNALAKTFLKNMKWWYIFLVILCIGNFIHLQLQPEILEITRKDFLTSIGIFSLKDNFFNGDILFIIYQLFLTFHNAIVFYDFEKNNSPEFVYMKINKLKLIFQKFVTLIIFIIIIRTIYFGINYFLYYKEIIIYFKDYLLTLIFNIIVLIIVTFIQIFKFTINNKNKVL